MIRVCTNILGAFAIKDGKIIERVLFPRNPKEIADRIVNLRDGVCEEELKLIEKLKESNVKEVHVSNPTRFHDKKIMFSEDTEFTDPSEIALELGIAGDEFNSLLFEVNARLTERRLKEIEKDQLIIQAINSLDDIEETVNTLIKRLREWNSLNFPELDPLITSHETYVRVLLSPSSLDKGLLGKIEKIRKKSLGIEFSEDDSKAIESLANSIMTLYTKKKEIESYVIKVMDEVAPNISALAGPLLGARLMAISGSLKRLALLPASTIQVLGAEDAFFRFLKKRKNPPKHGVIFQLPEIRSAPKNMRGRISRKFAAKLAIAARVDYFRGEFIGDRLRADFMKKIEKLK